MMEKLHLKNDTYQVWDRGTLWFQGTEEECDKYIAGDIINYGDLLEQNKIPELSDDDIADAASSYSAVNSINGLNVNEKYNDFVYACEWYREQIKSKQ